MKIFKNISESISDPQIRTEYTPSTFTDDFYLIWQINSILPYAMMIRFEQINQWSEVVHIYYFAILWNLFSFKIIYIWVKISSLKFISIIHAFSEVRDLTQRDFSLLFFKYFFCHSNDIFFYCLLNVINLMKNF